MKNFKSECKLKYNCHEIYEKALQILNYQKINEDNLSKLSIKYTNNQMNCSEKEKTMAELFIEFNSFPKEFKSEKMASICYNNKNINNDNKTEFEKYCQCVDELSQIIKDEKTN